MRLFDVDAVPLFLDAVSFRAEKTPDGDITVADLTLRVQPLHADLAEALDPELRAEIFTKNGEPRPKVTSLGWRLPVDRQHLHCAVLADQATLGDYELLNAEISDPRVRAEKGLDGFALVFYATVGPLGSDDLEFLVLRWLRTQRFVTFREAQGDLLSDAAEEPSDKPRGRRRQFGGEIPEVRA
jgi:hypothetical protein